MTDRDGRRRARAGCAAQLAASAALLAVGLVAAPAQAGSAPPPPVGLIAYVDDNPTSGRTEIFTIRTDGSRLTQLTTTGGWSPTWSPDGSAIAYQRRNGIWLMNADGGGREHVVDGADAAWAPDGQHLSYQCNDGEDLCVVDVTTGASEVVVAGTSDWPGVGTSSWSPDGASIVFTRYSSEGDDYTSYRQLFVVSADGTGLTDVPNTYPRAINPAWSPDGESIMYTDRYDGRGGEGSGDLWSVAADGTDQVRLTSQYGSEDAASWAPDGSRAAIYSEAGYLPYQAGIWTMAADGTDRELVVRGGYSPSWHPVFAVPPTSPPEPPTDSGPLIAYVGASDAGNDLFVVRPDGSGRRQLTTTGQVRHPAWSPNHRQVAFSDGSAGGSGGLWVMHVRDGTSRRVAGGAAVGSGFSWSPDGRELVWGRYDALVILDLRSGERRRIKTPVGCCLADVSWSPNGRLIAYAVDTGNATRLAVLPVAGGPPRALTRLPGREGSPDWSPDGAWVVFTHEQGSWWEPDQVTVERVRADGTRVRTVQRSRGITAGASWSPDGTRLAMYADGPRPFGAAPTPGLWTMGPAGGRARLVVPGRAIADVDW